MLTPIPANLASLHEQEQWLRAKAVDLIAADARLSLHLEAIEGAMDVADVLRQAVTADEDLKVALVLGMRTFNAFGAATMLALSGYGQNSAAIMRDILETVFLLDLFRTDRSAITRWRLASKSERKKKFSPVHVRTALDNRDGFTSMGRARVYEMFCELATHPTMVSVNMIRPRLKGDAVSGPFMTKDMLDAVLSEMGRLAVQVGDILSAFLPAGWGDPTRLAFAQTKQNWFAEFYPPQKAPPAVPATAPAS